ncbi:MAG: hypothetical protein ACKO96_23695 [Flammeovirgaceae bacterium]
MDAKEKLVEVYLTRIRNNEIEFDQIRKELEARNLDNEIISSVVKEVDQVLRTDLSISETDARANKLLLFWKPIRVDWNSFYYRLFVWLVL